jgi:hypothetical protein
MLTGHLHRRCTNAHPMQASLPQLVSVTAGETAAPAAMTGSFGAHRALLDTGGVSAETRKRKPAAQQLTLL